MAKTGTIIDNRYKIISLIGHGGMSKVYLALNIHLNLTCAIKEYTINPFGQDKEIKIQSAILEADLMKKFKHDFLPRILDVIKSKDSIYIVMDYVEGRSLGQIVDESGAQSQNLVIEWAKQLCDVLIYLHTNNPPIIYRDMKPSNIILRPNNNIMLLDFGSARYYKEKSFADTTYLGTTGYAAPEQYGGMGQTDQRTDIYGLGVTLHQLITGINPCKPPYKMNPIRYYNTSLSVSLEHIILKCTQLNPNDRYQSCSALLDELNNYKEIKWKYHRRFEYFCLSLPFIKTILRTKAEQQIQIKPTNDPRIIAYSAKAVENLKSEPDNTNLDGGRLGW